MSEIMAQAWHLGVIAIPFLPKRKPYQLAAIAALALGWAWHTIAHQVKENPCSTS